MALTLDHFVAASAGLNSEEVYVKPANDRAGNLQLKHRGRVGRLVTSEAQLRRDRVATANAFKDAVVNQIGSQLMLLNTASDNARSLYQRHLKMLKADIGASLDLHIRGDRALTGRDIQILAGRVNKKILEAVDKSIALHSTEESKRTKISIADISARQAVAWNGLCPTTPFTTNRSEQKRLLKEYFQTRPDFRPEKLVIIDEHFRQLELTINAAPEQVAVLLTEGLEVLHKDLLGYSLDTAVPRNKVQLDVGAVLGSGAFGEVRELSMNGEEKIYKSFIGDKKYAIEMSNSPTNPKLIRGQELTAAYLNDEEKNFIVTPTHFMVHETIPGRPVNRLVVAVKDKEFRAWAKDQLIKNRGVPGYELRITGQIQDKAEGSDLNDASQHGRISSEMMKPIGRAYMNALIAMAKRGFVHGDIKPGNSFYDPSINRLKLIDTGGLAKVSKQGYRKETTLFDRGRGHTGAYSLPAVANRENVGPEADLFSVGVAMLVLSLRQQGVRSEAKAFLSFLNDNYADVNRKTKTVEQANHAIEHYLDTSLSLAANECDIAAMRIIKEAIALSTVNFINPREQLIPVLERLRDSF